MRSYTKQLIFLSSFVSVAFISCLKDKDYDNGIIQSVRNGGETPKVVEISLTATNNTNFFVLPAIDNSNDEVTVDLVPVTLATNAPAAQDIHVTLTPTPALVDAFNANNGTAYADPAGLYSLVNGGVVTIPKGSNTGILQIKFTPSGLLGGDWAIGFTITKIDESGYEISGNLNTGITAIPVKNEFEGSYTTSGTRTRYAGPTEASGVLDMFDISGSQYFSTLNGNTIVGQLGDAGSGGIMALTINGDGTVTVSNPPGGPYADLANTAGTTSTYDAATKTFHILASYHNSAGNLRKVDETMVKE